VYRYWESAVQPLLQARSPKTIVEVGAADGANTRLIASWAAEHEALLHVVDPKPRFDVDAYTQRWAGHLEVHLELSLPALPAIGAVDMVLLDGDHNWYTMINELREIDRVNGEWPLVLMHDLDWPYGRRDMYYDPDGIPAEHRQPYRRRAIERFRSALVGRGMNPQAFNAKHEGGPRNGVLTAVEDFLSETDRDLLLFARPGPGGLGILASAEALRNHARLKETVARVHDPEFAVTISPVYGTREFGEDRPAPRGRLAKRLQRAQKRVTRRRRAGGRQ